MPFVEDHLHGAGKNPLGEHVPEESREIFHGKGLEDGGECRFRDEQVVGETGKAHFQVGHGQVVLPHGEKPYQVG